MSDHPVHIPYSAELARKALHLGALVMPLGILALGRGLALYLLVPLAVLAVTCDVARQRIPWMHRFIQWVFSGIMRPEEQPPFGGPIVLNGATWMCVSAAVCAALFSEPVAAAALTLLMVGDGAAAVVGRRWGRTRFPGSPKSLEGSAAFVVAGLAFALPILAWPGVTLPAGVLVAGAVIAAVIEVLPIPVNDNLRVPVLAGAAMASLAALL